MHINTHTAIAQTDQNHAVTLVVVGTAGCGKSVAIRKGLKNYDLSEPSASLPGANSSIRYTRRVGRVAQEDGSDCPLNVIEVDITDSMLESSISPVDNLPEALRVDGVIICYDASVESSFTPVEDLLQGGDGRFIFQFSTLPRLSSLEFPYPVHSAASSSLRKKNQ
ncbi:hypothetical protein MPER_09117 [Moniliophthora perniciosa FA553]|nr:hypothetical protein MPER_09117 [Moniliophthora perniciosa FA553]